MKEIENLTLLTVFARSLQGQDSKGWKRDPYTKLMT